MAVDSFRYVSPLVARYYKLAQVKAGRPIPWSPLPRPLTECRFGLVTSGGLYHRPSQRPFDLEREQRDPTWGDPTYRIISREVDASEIGVSHLHIKEDDILEDMNILLPINRFESLVEQGRIGNLADQAYSFMGYQGFPPDLSAWKEIYGPQVRARLLAEEVDCVLLTAA